MRSICILYVSLWGPCKARGQNGVFGSYMHAVFELRAHEASEMWTRLPHTFTKEGLVQLQWRIQGGGARGAGAPPLGLVYFFLVLLYISTLALMSIVYLQSKIGSSSLLQSSRIDYCTLGTKYVLDHVLMLGLRVNATWFYHHYNSTTIHM